MDWPLETVKLIDVNLAPVDEWIGYLVPGYLGGLPNTNAAACYTLEFECGLIWRVGCGDLAACVWDALMVHEHWCRSVGQRADPAPGEVRPPAGRRAEP